MKVTLPYDEFLAATINAAAVVYFHHDQPVEPNLVGSFVAQAMVKGVTLDYRDTRKPPTWDVDFSGIALEVLAIPE